MTDMLGVVEMAKTKLNDVDAFLQKSQSYRIVQLSTNHQDYDGEIQDFVRGYLLSSIIEPTRALAISVYLDSINVLIADKYELEFETHRDFESTVKALTSILEYLSGEGFEQTEYFFLGKKMGSRATLSKSILQLTNGHNKLKSGFCPTFLSTEQKTTTIRF